MLSERLVATVTVLIVTETCVIVDAGPEFVTETTTVVCISTELKIVVSEGPAGLDVVSDDTETSDVLV